MTENNATELNRTSTREAVAEQHDTADGLVLYTGSDDTVHQLNAVSTLIYELSDGRPVSSIAESIAIIFDLDTAASQKVAADGFSELARLGLVR